MTSLTQDAAPYYRQIAGQLHGAISGGTLRPGDRLPSVRQLSLQYGVSLTTALQAYRHLENEQLIEAKPKSGYYVASRSRRLPEPEFNPHIMSAGFVAIDSIWHDYVKRVEDPDAMPLYCGRPDQALLPLAKLQAILASANRRHPEYACHYGVGGSVDLRKQIARRSFAYGTSPSPEELVISSGGMEAIYLSLRAVASAGDTIAIESPTFFLMLLLIKGLGMKALEIPTHPRDGISLEALDFATQTPGAVKACLLMPNFNNPLGSLMPESNKKRLVAMMAERNIPIIENDIYGEMYFDNRRPQALQSYDTDGLVIYCSAFTKTVAPGYRIGWIAPGRYLKEVETLKLNTSVSCPLLQQEVLARFMRDGGYDHHMRKLRAALKLQAEQMSAAVAAYFPPGCRVSRPQGGFMLWVELPRHINARELYAICGTEHIGLVPGSMFTCGRKFDHFIRINTGMKWSARLEQRMKRLGEIITELAGSYPGMQRTSASCAA